MIIANVGIYQARAGDGANAFLEEVRILNEFRQIRSRLKRAGKPMTGEQMLAYLDLLTDAKAKRDATIVLVDEAFDETEPITEGDE